MSQQTLTNRVGMVEHRMQSLEELPARVSALGLQISQFREEVRLDFSAVRGEIQSLGETLRTEMRVGDEETRRQMRVLHEDVISRIAILNENLNGRRRAQRKRGDKRGATKR